VFSQLYICKFIEDEKIPSVCFMFFISQLKKIIPILILV